MRKKESQAVAKKKKLSKTESSPRVVITKAVRVGTKEAKWVIGTQIRRSDIGISSGRVTIRGQLEQL